MSLGLDAIFQIHEPTCTRYQLSSVVNTRFNSLGIIQNWTVYKTAGLNEAHTSLISFQVPVLSLPPLSPLNPIVSDSGHGTLRTCLVHRPKGALLVAKSDDLRLSTCPDQTIIPPQGVLGGSDGLSNRDLFPLVARPLGERSLRIERPAS